MSDPVLALFGPRMRTGEALAPHMTFRVGGPADYYIRADTAAELAQFVRWGRQMGLPVLVLGRGSNLLVSDGGWRGLVVENRTDAVDTVAEQGDLLTVRAESGASLPGLSNRLARQGWSGLEWAIGVPGSVGASVVGNAGAHGGCMADCVTVVQVLDEQNNSCEFSKVECAFGYRDSRFKRNRGREIVLTATLELRRDDVEACIARMSKYTEHRRRTQPSDPSVGSMFKNPAGDYAGRLIEAAGLKGLRVGQVQVSTVHANFFVNLGGATSAEVVELIHQTQAAVRARSGIELELEIELVGEGF